MLGFVSGDQFLRTQKRPANTHTKKYYPDCYIKKISTITTATGQKIAENLSMNS